MSDLLADFEAHRGRPGSKLRVDAILKQLDREHPDRAKALRTALAEVDRYEERQIARTVTKEWGLNLSRAAVRNWRDRNGLLDA